ncbi:glycosyltransferase [Pyxidicoccus fallax]|uniref:Glycosyltransferase n=2 Tax=Pyxidicoccus fallax TaxID=394095 RepID=A0A848LSR9_9BACT|nr:glycosyltransferase [Pyxidicoccus fallax]NPC84301.1 glycosyltransferase [Pyxidicoccus fallax]
MARAFAEAGHEVHVLTAPRAGLVAGGLTEPPGVRIHAVEELQGGFAGAFAHPPLRHAMAVYTTLKTLHARHSFDFIEFPERECEGFFALRAKRTLGHFASAVLAVRLHTPTAELLKLNRVATLTQDSAQQEFFEAASIREADLVLSPTRALLERLGPGHSGVVVPYPLALPTESAAVHPRPSVLYLGPLEYRKGVHLLIDAMQALFARGLRAQVRLIGDDTPTGPGGGSLLQWLKRRIDPAWSERFHFEPHRADTERAIATAAVCCVPSLWDNLPYEGLGALAAGCLVVASDAGGLTEVIEEGRSGLLFRSGDVAHLTDVLEKALGTPAPREATREHARARIAAYCHPASIVRQVEAAVADAAPKRYQGPPKPAARAPGSDAPLVSFLVPYYNMGRYLPETLRSIRAQTLTDYEIVLVDDGSTDSESRALLDTLHAPDLRIVRKRNGGLSSARNAGLRVARGRYILPLDPDDLIEPTFLEKAVAVMEATPGLGYVTSLVAYFRESPENVVGGWIPSGLDRDALWVVNAASTCTALMERRLLEALGGYDEWLTAFEDWDVFSRMAERGLTGMVIPEPLFLYRRRSDSMTHTLRLAERLLLLSYLSNKHATLALDPGRSLRIREGEAHRMEARLLAEVAAAVPPPLMNRVADRVNGTLKRFDLLHHTLRSAARHVAPDESRPIRHQLVDRLRRKPPSGA